MTAAAGSGERLPAILVNPAWAGAYGW